MFIFVLFPDPFQEPVQRGALQDPLAEERRLPLRAGGAVHQGEEGQERGQVHWHLLQASHSNYAILEMNNN